MARIPGRTGRSVVEVPLPGSWISRRSVRELQRLICLGRGRAKGKGRCERGRDGHGPADAVRAGAVGDGQGHRLRSRGRINVARVLGGAGGPVAEVPLPGSRDPRGRVRELNGLADRRRGRAGRERGDEWGFGHNGDGLTPLP